LIKIVWTHLAVADLQKISYFIESDRDLDTANRVCRIIYDSVQLLRRFPEAGKRSMEEDTREWIIPALPSYIAVYSVGSESVKILRIWHGAQKRN
jgi:plasmid stabilization system protein ParE